LVLKIELPGVKRYDFNIDFRTLIFRSLRPASYGFNLELYRSVHSPEVQVMELCTKIILKKEVRSYWPRVQEEKIHLPWLEPDDEIHSDTDGSDDESKAEEVSR